VSLEVHPGQIMAVLGPNGAGKSTLFRVLTGLTTPTSGHAKVLGYDTTRESIEVRRLVGFMPAENRTLLLRHSCRENLAFHGRLQGIPKRELRDRVDEVLDIVGLYEARDRVGFALSSGMLARLMFARAILHRPEVLILDEPTGAVDPLGAFELISMIQRIAAENDLAVLISSHRLDEVEMLNDQVVLLNRGRIMYSGHLSGMTAAARRPRIEIVTDSEAAATKVSATLDGADGIETQEVDGTAVLVTTDLPLDSVLHHLNGLGDSIVSIGRTPPRLRDVLNEMLNSKNPEGTA
jgi:ABC-2 type transport system ATP-binding protein